MEVGKRNWENSGLLPFLSFSADDPVVSDHRCRSSASVLVFLLLVSAFFSWASFPYYTASPAFSQKTKPLFGTLSSLRQEQPQLLLFLCIYIYLFQLFLDGAESGFNACFLFLVFFKLCTFCVYNSRRSAGNKSLVCKLSFGTANLAVYGVKLTL